MTKYSYLAAINTQKMTLQQQFDFCKMLTHFLYKMNIHTNEIYQCLELPSIDLSRVATPKKTYPDDANPNKPYLK